MAHVASLIEKTIEKNWKDKEGKWKPQFFTKDWNKANALVQKMAFSFGKKNDVVFVVSADLDFSHLNRSLDAVQERCVLSVSVFPSRSFMLDLEKLVSSQKAAESQDLEDFITSEVLSLRDLVEGWVKGYEAGIS